MWQEIEVSTLLNTFWIILLVITTYTYIVTYYGNTRKISMLCFKIISNLSFDTNFVFGSKLFGDTTWLLWVFVRWQHTNFITLLCLLWCKIRLEGCEYFVSKCEFVQSNLISYNHRHEMFPYLQVRHAKL